MRGVLQRMPVVLNGHVVGGHDETQPHSHLGIMMLPKVDSDQGHQRNAKQENDKRRHHPYRRQRGMGGGSEDKSHAGRKRSRLHPRWNRLSTPSPRPSQ